MDGRAQKIVKNDVSYMGVKKLLVLGGWRVGWGWGGGGVVEASCRTITIATGSKNREK